MSNTLEVKPKQIDLDSINAIQNPIKRDLMIEQIKRNQRISYRKDGEEFTVKIMDKVGKATNRTMEGKIEKGK